MVFPKLIIIRKNILEKLILYVVILFSHFFLYAQDKTETILQGRYSKSMINGDYYVVLKDEYRVKYPLMFKPEPTFANVFANEKNMDINSLSKYKDAFCLKQFYDSTKNMDQYSLKEIEELIIPRCLACQEKYSNVIEEVYNHLIQVNASKSFFEEKKYDITTEEGTFYFPLIAGFIGERPYLRRKNGVPINDHNDLIKINRV